MEVWDVFKLFEEGSKKGLKDNEVFENEFHNPQRLYMGELRKRIYHIKATEGISDNFRGGAYSGD